MAHPSCDLGFRRGGAFRTRRSTSVGGIHSYKEHAAKEHVDDGTETDDA
jgi:hypothetical protein